MGQEGARGLLGGEGAQHSTLHSPEQHHSTACRDSPSRAQWADGWMGRWMDGQMDGGATPPAVTLPLGRSCP